MIQPLKNMNYSGQNNHKGALPDQIFFGGTILVYIFPLLTLFRGAYSCNKNEKQKTLGEGGGVLKPPPPHQRNRVKLDFFMLMVNIGRVHLKYATKSILN